MIIEDITEILNRLADHTALVVMNKDMEPVNVEDYAIEIRDLVVADFIEMKLDYKKRIIETIEKVK